MRIPHISSKIGVDLASFAFTKLASSHPRLSREAEVLRHDVAWPTASGSLLYTFYAFPFPFKYNMSYTKHVRVRYIVYLTIS